MKNTDFNALLDGKERYALIGDYEFLASAEKEIEGVKVIPVFERFNSKNNSFGSEYKWEFDGYIIDGTYYTQNGFYLKDWHTGELVADRICTLSALSDRLSSKVVEMCSYQLEKEYDSIQSTDYVLSEKEKADVKKEFMEGCLIRSEEEFKSKIHNYMKKMCEDDFYSGFEILSYLNETDEKLEKLAEENWKCIKEQIAIEKAKRSFFEILLKSNINDSKVVVINRLFNQLKEEGRKTVNVTFNFGYAKVTEKVAVKRGYWFIEGCRSKTSDFQENYVQSFSMKHNEFEEFLPYIEKVSYGKKTLYEEKVDCPYQTENQLASLVLRLEQRDCNDEIVAFIENNTFDKEVMLQKNLIDIALRNFYSNLDAVKALVSIGCKVNEKSLETDGYYHHRSRNRAEIVEYLKSIKESESEE